MSEDARSPAFARDFPKVPEIDSIVGAFAEGDYARVRREAARLADTAEDEAVRRAARELASRVRPDSIAAWLLGLTLALLVFLTAWWILHARPTPVPSPGPPPPAIEHVR